MRWIVCTVSGVCNVASTRWPVSAAISAVSMVSKSRISPMTITSGSCRKTCTNASRNERTSVPTSCCTMMLRRLSWTNSTGSSIVTILARRLRLIDVDHEVERGRLAHARGAGQQDQAVVQAAQFFDHGRKPQFGGRADRLFAQPNGQFRDSRHESRRWRESGRPLPRAARSKAATAPGESRACLGSSMLSIRPPSAASSSGFPWLT